MLAAVLILSRCRYLISHTGNVGLWIYLFRGHGRNACQLIPARPDIISCYENELRMKQRILRRVKKSLMG